MNVNTMKASPGTTLHRSSASNCRVGASRPVNITSKEDAGVCAPADEPYGFFARTYLKFMGLVLARQLI
jgi:hypothetical protein